MSFIHPVDHDRTQSLLRGLLNSGLCVMYHDTDLAVRLVENPPPDWPPVARILELGDAAIFDPVTAGRVIETKRSVLYTGAAARLEVALRAAGQPTRWYELHIEPDRDPPTADDPTPQLADTENEAIRGLFVSITDITELKTREETLRALIYEVSHRSRNLLAIVQSVLGHTARSSDSIATFERKFRGRIAALAHSQDLITRSNWQGVRFQRLVWNQISDHVGVGVTPPAILGPDPLISPNTAMHLGLALHELAANSVSYGVLEHGKGEITIETAPTSDGQSMIWSEALADPRTAPPGNGFGQTILRQIVPRAVNGQGDYRITPDHIIYKIDWPEAAAV